jgi:hypothetical protein
MLFVYQPEGAQRTAWEFEPNKLMSPEAEAIERHTGMTYNQWTKAVTEGSILALHGLLYVMLKRTEPTLKWDSVQFCLDDVDFELDDTEAADAVARLEALEDRTPAQDNLLATLKAGQEDVPKGDPSSVPDPESSDDAA